MMYSAYIGLQLVSSHISQGLVIGNHIVHISNILLNRQAQAKLQSDEEQLN
jgi:hypothetical protein